MNELQLYKFIEKNNIEWHYTSDCTELYAFIDIIDLKEFNDLLGASIKDEDGISCIMKDGYFVFEMIAICEYFGIKHDNIFPFKSPQP